MLKQIFFTYFRFSSRTNIFFSLKLFIVSCIDLKYSFVFIQNPSNLFITKVFITFSTYLMFDLFKVILQILKNEPFKNI